MQTKRKLIVGLLVLFLVASPWMNTTNAGKEAKLKLIATPFCGVVKLQWNNSNPKDFYKPMLVTGKEMVELVTEPIQETEFIHRNISVDTKYSYVLLVVDKKGKTITKSKQINVVSDKKTMKITPDCPCLDDEGSDWLTVGGHYTQPYSSSWIKKPTKKKSKEKKDAEYVVKSIGGEKGYFNINDNKFDFDISKGVSLYAAGNRMYFSDGNNFQVYFVGDILNTQNNKNVSIINGFKQESTTSKYKVSNVNKAHPLDRCGFAISNSDNNTWTNIFITNKNKITVLDRNCEHILTEKVDGEIVGNITTKDEYLFFVTKDKDGGGSLNKLYFDPSDNSTKIESVKYTKDRQKYVSFGFGDPVPGAEVYIEQEPIDDPCFPIDEGGNVYLLSAEKEKNTSWFTKVNTAEMKNKWSVKLSAPTICHPMILHRPDDKEHEGSLISILTADGKLTLYNSKDGKVISQGSAWDTRPPANISQPTMIPGNGNYNTSRSNRSGFTCVLPDGSQNQITLNSTTSRDGKSKKISFETKTIKKEDNKKRTDGRTFSHTYSNLEDNIIKIDVSEKEIEFIVVIKDNESKGEDKSVVIEKFEMDSKIAAKPIFYKGFCLILSEKGTVYAFEIKRKE